MQLITMGSLNTLFYLVARDLAVFRPRIATTVVNCFIWILLTSLTAQYVMVRAGMPDNYGVFIMCANSMTWGLFDVRGQIAVLIRDICGNRSIDYYLTLPIPQWLIFCRIAISAALQSMIIVGCMLPLTKILLWSHLDLSAINWVKFATVFVLVHVMYGFFVIYVASFIQGMHQIPNAWSRFINPLWLAGGYSFKWSMLYKLSPWIGYISLCNPTVYAYEAMRGVVIGQSGYIPFWYCVAAFILFSYLFGYYGTKRMLCRLDCL